MDCDLPIELNAQISAIHASRSICKLGLSAAISRFAASCRTVPDRIVMDGPLRNLIARP